MADVGCCTRRCSGGGKVTRRWHSFFRFLVVFSFPFGQSNSLAWAGVLPWFSIKPAVGLLCCRRSFGRRKAKRCQRWIGFRPRVDGDHPLMAVVDVVHCTFMFQPCLVSVSQNPSPF